jgi:phage shock protein E
MLSFLKNLFTTKPPVDFKAIIAKGGVIIDVRRPMEFSSGHIKGAVNIPLDAISSHVDELKKKNKVIVTVCLSGTRSGMARRILQNNGLEVYNGGSWLMLQTKIR